MLIFKDLMVFWDGEGGPRVVEHIGRGEKTSSPTFILTKRKARFTKGRFHPHEGPKMDLMQGNLLKFPNAVILNAGRTQKDASERKRAQMIAKERKTQIRKRAQKSAKERKRAQKGAKERKRAQKSASALKLQTTRFGNSLTLLGKIDWRDLVIKWPEGGPQ